MTENGRFPRRAKLVVSALLSEPTIAQAAQKAGVSESTVYRLLRKPAFTRAFRAARQAVV